MSKYEVVGRGAGGRSGQILRRVGSDDDFLVRVTLGRDAKGKRRTRSTSVHGTFADAEAALAELSLAKHQRRLTVRSDLRLSEFAEEWLEHKAGKVSYRTAEGYRQMLAWYVLPTLGQKRLEAITLRDIDALFVSMQAGTLPESPKNLHGRPIGWQGGPLGASTIRQTHAALSQLLKQAVKWGLIPFNPALEATMPTIKATEKRTLTVAERDAFIKASAGAFNGDYYRLLLETGLRPGEACALRWSDIDFARGRILVQRTIALGKRGARVPSHPKTAKSRRTVPLFGLAETLLARRKWLRDNGLPADGYVFMNQYGGVLAPWAFDKKELQRITRKAGIDWRVTPYTFRHTFATLHLQYGTPIKVVSEWMGHSNIEQTGNTYQHVGTEVAMDYAARFMERLSKESRKEGERLAN